MIFDEGSNYMKGYKPISLEENYSNVQYLGNIFWNEINSFIWEYSNICWKYGDINRYHQLVCQNLINPYLNNPESEMRHLAYKVFGFTSNVFETLAYALDYWRIHTDSKQTNRNVTDKEYDQALRLLAKKHKISGSDKEILLDFRPQRNYCTHYGRIQFCVFIFNNSNVLYNLIQVITQLLGQMDVNSDRVSEFNAQQGNYIEDMKKVLDEFRIDNFNVA